MCLPEDGGFTSKRIRHDRDASKTINITMPVSHIEHYAPICPLREVLILALDALVDPQVWSTYVIASNGWNAYLALDHVTRAARDFTEDELTYMCADSEVWIGGYRDQRGHVHARHFYNTPTRRRDSGRRRWVNPTVAPWRNYSSGPVSQPRRDTPEYLRELHPRAANQKQWFLYRRFREECQRSDLRMWEFNTSRGNPKYMRCLWLFANRTADELTPEELAYIDEHYTQVRKAKRIEQMAIAMRQKELFEASNRELPHRKRILRIPETRPFKRTNTSLPHHELTQLRERAFRTTGDPVSRFCTYVWLWAHAPNFKVPHVVAAKLHAFAAGAQWEGSLERYRRSDHFKESPHALVNPLNGDLFGPTPGMTHPGEGFWCETMGKLQNRKEAHMPRTKAQLGMAKYLQEITKKTTSNE